MEKVLVTGANGLLGANIVRQLSAKGYLVRAMLRKGSDKLSLKGAKFELFEGEITRPGDVAKAVSGCGYIIHSAARTSQSPTKPEAFVKINIEATSNLIESCKRFKVKRFVFVSTANCFTNGTINQPGNESSGFMPWLKKSGYAYSKFLAQENVLREVKENSFPAIVVNPTFMIGPHDSKPSSGKLLLYGHKNRIVFYPPGGKSFVDVELAAKSICNALI
ncbi:MAG: NAD-dependent epimerase/dehydratase family protein, partial [Chlorobi bacterium]|nr:NAD-dependent epimerase/dehydratase family protein [Chlorobiota bacterium]